MTGQEPVRIAVLGCSDIARRKFIPALRRSRHAVLAAVASRDRERAERFVPDTGCRALTYDEAVATEAAEVIYISLPNHLHEEWVLRALEGGKHVLCEKPLGLSLASVRRMTGLARRHGLLVAENIMFLHHRQHPLVKELVAAGKIGTVRRFRASFGFLLRDPVNFRLDPHRGGGAFHDLARYPLAAARFFLDASIDRFSGIRLQRGDLTVGVHGYATVPGGTVVDLSVSFEQQYESLYEIVGDKGAIRLDRAFTTPEDAENIIQLTQGSERSTIAVPADDHFLRMIDHLAACASSPVCRETEYRQAEDLAAAAEIVWGGCREVPLA